MHCNPSAEGDVARGLFAVGEGEDCGCAERELVSGARLIGELERRGPGIGKSAAWTGGSPLSWETCSARVAKSTLPLFTNVPRYGAVSFVAPVFSWMFASSFAMMFFPFFVCL